MRMMLVALLLAASAGMAAADDGKATVATAAPQSSDQQAVPQQTPADNAAIEQLFYGYSGSCPHQSARQTDTAKLLMN